MVAKTKKSEAIQGSDAIKEVEINGKEANPERMAFINRTHTTSTLTVTLEVFSPRHSAADLGIATNMQQLGTQLTELLKGEAVKLVATANKSALQYEEFTPGLAVSRSSHYVAQKELSSRDYEIYVGMVTEPALDAVAN
jgi:hypothetical protein